MLEFLFGKKKKNPPKDVRINEIYTKLSAHYEIEKITPERKKYLQNIMIKHGYLNYPYIKAIEELTPAEILYSLQFKWIDNHIFNDGKFRFDDNQISALARENIKTSDWIKKEGHDIKLINLAGLKDGNSTKETGKFIDWLRQLLILPTGNIHNEIFNTTIYLIPFHPREFGCAYLPKSSEVSEKLFDEEIFNITGMDAKEQVKTFITFAQLAGHPVIYDILPQTGRFSKAVLANPEIARWYDIESLLEQLRAFVDALAENCTNDILDELKKDGISGCDHDDIEVVKKINKLAISPSFELNTASFNADGYALIPFNNEDERLTNFKVEAVNKESISLSGDYFKGSAEFVEIEGQKYINYTPSGLYSSDGTENNGSGALSARAYLKISADPINDNYSFEARETSVFINRLRPGPTLEETVSEPIELTSGKTYRECFTFMLPKEKGIYNSTTINLDDVVPNVLTQTQLIISFTSNSPIYYSTNALRFNVVLADVQVLDVEGNYEPVNPDTDGSLEPQPTYMERKL